MAKWIEARSTDQQEATRLLIDDNDIICMIVVLGHLGRVRWLVQLWGCTIADGIAATISEGLQLGDLQAEIELRAQCRAYFLKTAKPCGGPHIALDPDWQQRLEVEGQERVEVMYLRPKEGLESFALTLAARADQLDRQLACPACYPAPVIDQDDTHMADPALFTK